MRDSDLEAAELGVLLSRIRRFLRRNRKVIIGFALGGGVLLGVIALTSSNRYGSSISLMIDEDGVNPNAPKESGTSEILSFVESQVHVIDSRDILQRVVDVARLGEVEEYQKSDQTLIGYPIRLLKSAIRSLGESDSDRSGAAEEQMESHEVRKLRRNVTVSRLDKTNVIKVSVESTSPALAARIARTIGEVYIEDRSAHRHRRARELADWVDERLLELRDRLSKAEEAVTAYRIENDLISGDPDSTLGEQQLIELNTILIETRAALAEKRATYARSQQLLEDDGDLQILPEIQNTDLVTAIRTRLVDLNLRETELRRLNPGDLRLRVISDERKEVEDLLTREIARLVAMIRHQLETLEAREALLADALKEAGERSGEESRSSDRLRALERVVQGYQALYERYLGTAGVVDEEVSLLLSSIDIIERPVIADEPFYPPNKLFVIWGLLLGGVLGVMISILRDATRQGFSTSMEVEAMLGLPVIAMLPPAGSVDSLREAVIREPGRPLAKAVRSLRLDLSASDGDPSGGRSLLVTSVLAADGAPGLARAVAASAGQAGKTVLLIDAIPNGGVGAALTGPASGPGLDAALGGADLQQLIRQDAALPGVNILSADSNTASPDSLSGPAMHALLARACDCHDLVIIMAPPAQDSPDVRYLARMVDRTVLVLRESETPRVAALAAADRLRLAPPSGIVMVNCNARRVRDHGETRFMHELV